MHLRVALPDNPQISPTSFARLTLIAEADGQPAQSVTRDVPAMPAGAPAVSFGDLAVGRAVRISVLGFAASGRLVGFGRALQPVDITSGDVREVDILLRRPFAYVTGGSSLHLFDTTVEPGTAFASTLDAVEQPTAVATTPDGAEVVVVAAGMLSLVSTKNHQRTGAAPVAVAAGATEAAVSPDGRWAVVLHTSGDGPLGASLVDLAALRTGTTKPTFVELDAPGAIAVSTDTAYVLVSPSLPGPPPDYVEDCTTLSKIVPIPLAAGAQAGAPIALAGAARRLAVAGNALLVAEPCSNGVVSVTLGGASQVRLLTAPSATSVAISGGRVWAIGHAGGTNDVHLVLVTANLDGSAPSRLDFPVTQELAQSSDLAEDGEIVEVRLDADRLDAYGLSILPDGRNVALLVHGSYHADPVTRGATETIVPRMDLDTYEYELVDVTTGLASQRVRTSCNIDWDHGVALLDTWACAAGASQQGIEDFVPGQAAILFGAQ